MPKSVENSVSPPVEPVSSPASESVPWRLQGDGVTGAEACARAPTPRGGLTIRAMELPDIADVTELESRVFPDPWSADSFLSELERRPEIGSPIVVRDRADELVGYAIMWFIVDEAHIGNVAVDPRRQGQGVGTFLLNHVLAEARHREMAFATLEVRPSNRVAVHLYRRLGFRKVGVRKNYYRNDREDALVLALELHRGAEARLG